MNNKEDRNAFKRLVEALEMFREAGGDSHVEIQTVLSYLYIVLDEGTADNGLNVKDVAERLGSSTATGSRNCTLLSTGFRGAKKKGMGFIELFEDPQCRIKKIITLTKKGIAFKQRLLLVFES